MNVNRLKEIREDKDLFQKDIATILNITQQQYNKYEMGINIMSGEKYDKLANYYNVSVDYLMGRTDIRKSYPKSIMNKKDYKELIKYSL